MNKSEIEIELNKNLVSAKLREAHHRSKMRYYSEKIVLINAQYKRFHSLTSEGVLNYDE